MAYKKTFASNAEISFLFNVVLLQLNKKNSENSISMWNCLDQDQNPYTKLLESLFCFIRSDNLQCSSMKERTRLKNPSAIKTTSSATRTSVLLLFPVRDFCLERRSPLMESVDGLIRHAAGDNKCSIATIDRSFRPSHQTGAFRSRASQRPTATRPSCQQQ